MRRVNVGDTGYIFAMTSKGDLTVHIAREGENIWDEKDENGRYFIREMAHSAVTSKTGAVQYIIYPWQNAVLGDRAPRKKIAAFRYFKDWDWIIAASGYLAETYEDTAFERRSFEELKAKLKAKKVGRTGYIYCMDSKGNFTIHPDAEGKNFFNARDSAGHAFIREMCEKKTGLDPLPLAESGRPQAADEDRPLCLLPALGLDRRGRLLRG